MLFTCHINDLIKKFHWKLLCHWNFFLFKCCITNQCVGNIHLIILSISHVLYLLMIFTNSYWFFSSLWPKTFCWGWVHIESLDYAQSSIVDWLWSLIIPSCIYDFISSSYLILQDIYNKWLFYWWFIYKWLTWWSLCEDESTYLWELFFFCPKTKSCVRGDLL